MCRFRFSPERELIQPLRSTHTKPLNHKRYTDGQNWYATHHSTRQGDGVFRCEQTFKDVSLRMN